MKLRLLIAVIVAAGLGWNATIAAQTAEPAPITPVAEVRQTLAEARKEMEAHKAAGGAAGTPDHPAIKWDAALWAYRDEIQHVSVGLQAPAVSGKPRNARQPITLESFRGKPVVLVFWGST